MILKLTEYQETLVIRALREYAGMLIADAFDTHNYYTAKTKIDFKAASEECQALANRFEKGLY